MSGQTIDSSALLGCPFCGGKARFVIAFGREAVACQDCLAVMRSMRLDNDRQDLSCQWNNRKPNARLDRTGTAGEEDGHGQ